MYRTIEPDVRGIEGPLDRLRKELPTYDGKFPAQHVDTAKLISNVEITSRRAVFLKRQIEVARRIEALNPEDQFPAWQTQMEPLLTQEKELDTAH
jgi:hypothetical protein